MGGRYKGNAFVTFPSTEQAKKALDEITGYILHERPVVIVNFS